MAKSQEGETPNAKGPKAKEGGSNKEQVAKSQEAPAGAEVHDPDEGDGASFERA